MPESTWGGARPGAGRLRQRITVDLEHARLLRALLEHRQQQSPYPLTEDQVVEDLILAGALEAGLDTPALRAQIAADRAAMDESGQ